MKARDRQRKIHPLFLSLSLHEQESRKNISAWSTVALRSFHSIFIVLLTRIKQNVPTSSCRRGNGGAATGKRQRFFSPSTESCSAVDSKPHRDACVSFTMSTRSNVPLFDDRYCHTCSSIGVKRRLSSFHCEHCRLPMCYACYQQHSAIVNVESSSLDKHSPRSTAALEKKQELLATFEEHCVRCVDSTFDEVSSDLQNLRKESIHYVRQQFRHAEVGVHSRKFTTGRRITSRSIYPR